MEIGKNDCRTIFWLINISCNLFWDNGIYLYYKKIRKMKREIKFRAWDVETNKMIINFFIRTFGNKDDLILIPDKNVYDKVFDISYSENGLKVMQYTGMKDKNGKEIYEGDIVKNGIDIFEIGFRNGYFGAIDNRENCKYLFDFIEYKFLQVYCEVIGNIYENKELLK